MKIVGNIRPEDEGMHEVEEASNFNESAYFNFFDPARALGGFVRLGNRPNEGHAEMTVTLYLPDGRVLFHYARPEISTNGAFDAGGLCFELVEPTEKWRTSYDGTALELAEPREMADPKKAFTTNPFRNVGLALEHEAVGALYGSSGPAGANPEEEFARAHYEQHMRVIGEIAIDGEPLAIEGWGLRDHSWGPRTWQSIEGYEWLTINFGDDLGAMVTSIRKTGKDPRVGGVVVRGEEVDPIDEATIEADYEEGGLYHRRVRCRARTRSGGTFDVEGEVRSFLPLRNRRGGRTTHIGEGMTEWRHEGRTGFGLSEFLRTL